MINHKNTESINNLKRFALLLHESAYIDWPVIIWSLRPQARKRGEHFVKFLERKGIIKNYTAEKKFSFLEYNFYYEASDLAALTADLVSIWGRDFKYFREKFIDSGAYFFEGPYETDLVKIKPGDYVIDAGANLGLFTVLASNKVGSDGLIYSFEPIKKTRKLLEKNIKINNLENVLIEPFALGQKNESILFNVPNDLGGSSSVFSSSDLSSDKTEAAEMRTIDYLVSNGIISRFDFIKADIEGAERDLLAGARIAIQKFKPRLSLCTYHLEDDKSVLSKLLLEIEPGYEIYYSPTKMMAHYKGSKLN